MSKFIVSLCSVVALVVLGGCGTVSDITRDRVARGDNAVKQAEQEIDGSEAGAIELQRAKDEMNAARMAVDEGDGVKAERHAQQAELTAQLAVAKSQSAQTRKAADEVLASLDMLRREAAREPAGSTGMPRQPGGTP